MDIATLRESVKAVPCEEVLIWRNVLQETAKFFRNTCRYEKLPQEVGMRSYSLFERVVVLLDPPPETYTLYATTCLWMGNKFDLHDFVSAEQLAEKSAVTKSQMIMAEKVVLSTLNWCLYSPTTQQFACVIAPNDIIRDMAVDLIDEYWSHPSLLFHSSERVALDAVALLSATHSDKCNLFRQLAMESRQHSTPQTLECTRKRKRRRDHAK
jgi:hypothetical protein